ncbi:MlaD family protein [Frankia sp. CiP1_Cm_nod2]|uniref:MlaD family protein n=1 Tax=Frankia sp. CiP1_Cm_nod2 TaxID=2897161 RepID=UPI0020259232
MKLSMGRIWERLRTVPGLGRDVGAVTAMILAAIVAIYIMQSKMSITWPWTDHQTIRAEFESIAGVNPKSSPKVTIAGVTVGKVLDAHPTRQGTAILDLEIGGGHRIYDNAHAVLRPKNPLNDMTIEINPGGPPGKPLQKKGLIPLGHTERPVQADEVLQHLDERTQLAVTNLLVQSDVALVRAPEELPAGLQETDNTLVKMRPVLEALQTRREKISQLVTALAQIAGAVGKNDQRIAQLVDSTQQTLSVLANNDHDLQASLEQLPGLSDDLRQAMTSTQHLTTQLNPTLTGLGVASKSLPGTLDRFKKTVDQLDTTVDKGRPVVAKAKPVVADLRPLIANINPSFSDLLPVTNSLKQDTQTLIRYEDDIRAFIYNTSSVFGAGDSPETGIIRGHLVIPLPDGGLLPGGRDGYAPGPENGLEGGNR